MLIDTKTRKSVIPIEDGMAEVGPDEYVAIIEERGYVWYKNGKFLSGELEFDIEPNMKRIIMTCWESLIILYEHHFYLLHDDTIHKIELEDLSKFYVVSNTKQHFIGTNFVVKLYFMANNILYKLYFENGQYTTKKIKQFKENVTVLSYASGMVRYLKNDKTYISHIRMPIIKSRFKNMTTSEFGGYKITIHNNQVITSIIFDGAVIVNLCPESLIDFNSLESISHDDKYVLIKTQAGCYIYKAGTILCDHPIIKDNNDIEVVDTPL